MSTLQDLNSVWVREGLCGQLPLHITKRGHRVRLGTEDARQEAAGQTEVRSWRLHRGVAVTPEENEAICKMDSTGPGEPLNAEWVEYHQAGFLAFASGRGGTAKPCHNQTVDPHSSTQTDADCKYSHPEASTKHTHWSNSEFPKISTLNKITFKTTRRTYLKENAKDLK